MSGAYHLTHAKIAELTGLNTARVSKLGTLLGKVLDPYRTRGKSNACLYDSNGLIVWQQIAQMEKRGIGPQEIETKLGEAHEKAENQSDKDSLREYIEGGKRGKKKTVGNEVVPRFVYENTREDLKSEIADQRQEAKRKDRLIQDLQEQLRFLPAPGEWKQKIAEESRAREETIRLLKELKEIEEKTYGWFDRGVKQSDKARILQILRELDKLNFKH